MRKDFVEIGDVFNHEGTLYYVRGIPTPRSLALSKVNSSGLNHTHTYTVLGSSSIYWNEKASVWMARGGTVDMEGRP